MELDSDSDFSGIGTFAQHSLHCYHVTNVANMAEPS